MSKKSRRWPIWKIALATGGCAAVSVALCWLSALAERAAGGETNEAGTEPLITIPVFLLMMGVAAGLLCVLGAIWLIARIRDARIPYWEKKGRKKRW